MNNFKLPVQLDTTPKPADEVMPNISKLIDDFAFEAGKSAIAVMEGVDSRTPEGIARKQGFNRAQAALENAIASQPTNGAAAQAEPLAIPDDVRKVAKAMQKDGYRGPLAWATKVIDFVADYATPQPPADVSGAGAVEMSAVNFACYLIDHCERETVYEESVQRWLGAALKDKKYHATQAPSGEVDDDDSEREGDDDYSFNEQG